MPSLVHCDLLLVIFFFFADYYRISFRFSFCFFSFLKDFIRSQGKRVKLQPEFRQNLMDIFSELCQSDNKGTVSPKSAMAADVVMLGDSWLSFAIKEGLIQPIQGVEEQDWFQDLTDEWKVDLHLFPVILSFA